MMVPQHQRELVRLDLAVRRWQESYTEQDTIVLQCLAGYSSDQVSSALKRGKHIYLRYKCPTVHNCRSHNTSHVTTNPGDHAASHVLGGHPAQNFLTQVHHAIKLKCNSCQAEDTQSLQPTGTPLL